MVDPRGFIAAGLGVLAVVAIFLGLFTHGWVSAEWDDKYEETENSASYTAGGTLHIGLLEAESSSGLSSTSIDLSDLKGEDKDWYTGGLITYIILWAALLVCLGFIPCAILAALHKMSKIPGMILGYTGGGLMLLGAILYMIIPPHKLRGVDEVSLGWTFYVVVIGAGVQGIGGDLVRSIRKKSRESVSRDTPASGWGTPERSAEREDYYGESGRRDYPSHRRDDHYYRQDKWDRPPLRRDVHYHDREGMDDISILKKRLARGEITKQEYEELKRVIEE